MWAALILAGIGIVTAVALCPFIGIILFLIGAYFHPMAYLPIPKELYPTTLFGAGMLLLVGMRFLVTKETKSLGFPGLAIALCFSATFVISAAYNWGRHGIPWGLRHFLQFLLLYFAIIYLTGTRTQFLIVLGAFLSFGIIAALWGIYGSAVGIGVPGREEVYYATGFAGRHGIFAAQLITVIPLMTALMSFQKSIIVKALIFGLIGMLVSAVLLSFSRSGILILIPILLLCAWRYGLGKKRVLSVVILLGSLSSFFLPTHYELDQEKIKVRFFLTKREREWSAFRSFYVDKNGVLLSPFAKPSRLENFRGIYVRFNQNKDQVVDFVKSRIQR